jgi:uncharacterized protein (TIGR02996 family)
MFDDGATQDMNDEHAFMQAMQQHPEDNALRLVFADWLEERGDQRGELIRLLHTLTRSVEVPDRPKLEKRLRNLVADGVKPVGPFWTNSIGITFAWIPAGVFLMGSPNKEKYRSKSAEIQHKVTLTKGYWLGVHQVTQMGWQEVMGNSPSHFRGSDLPVEVVSWNDCENFLRTLSSKDGHSYRFPTEAEWEYACRAGTTTPFYFGETITTDQVNYWPELPYGDEEPGVYREQTTPVRSFTPNAFGLHDMHGNVWEWCNDKYGKYEKKEVIDPQGPMNRPYRAMRGGSFGSPALEVRSACRTQGTLDSRREDVGFRAASSPF